MEGDECFAGEGGIDAARALVQAAPDAELFLYTGDRHLFADSSLPSYDEPAATQLTQRVLTFLETLNNSGPSGSHGMTVPDGQPVLRSPAAGDARASRN